MDENYQAKFRAQAKVSGMLVAQNEELKMKIRELEARIAWLEDTNSKLQETLVNALDLNRNVPNVEEGQG